MLALTRASTIGRGALRRSARVVIEEFCRGEEASFIVMCDGKSSGHGHEPGP
jgi:phosphoribosylamine-glycine ligase